MTRALAWIRKSKGSDDDVGLEEQREVVPDMAAELAGSVDVFDLGVHTGFSSMTRDGSGLLDQREDVQNCVDELQSGRYDYVVAWDDRRICRDEYLSVIQYAAQVGGAEFSYVAEVPEDKLTFDIKRRVERDTKEEEIKKSRRAVQRRIQNGYDHGRPRFGMTYDDSGAYQVPGDKFDSVVDIFRLDDLGYSQREIATEVDEALGTVQNVLRRREWYQKRSNSNKK